MDLAKFFDAVGRAAPVVLAFTPLAPIAPFVAAGVTAAEAIPGAKGADKLALALQLARLGIAATNAQAGKVLVDPVLADEALVTGISAVVNALKLIEQTRAAVDPAALPRAA